MMKMYEEMPLQKVQSHLDSANRETKSLSSLQLAEVEVKTMQLTKENCENERLRNALNKLAGQATEAVS